MTSKTFLRNALRGCLGSLVATVAFNVSAVPVTQWGFAVNSGFTAFAPAGVTGSNTNTLLSAPSLLSWGTTTGFGQSSLGVGASTNGLFSGLITTNGAAVNTVQLIHNNNPITGTSLTSATLLDVITLQATNPAGPAFTPAALNFGINFLETTNAVTCLAPSPAGNPCNDIFVINVAGAGFNPADNSLNQTFDYGGEDYNAILDISGLGVLSNAICDGVFGNQLHRGCIGFTTIEGQQNTFQVALRITDTPYVVPEPASLALVGLAMLGLVAVRRGKSRA